MDNSSHSEQESSQVKLSDLKDTYITTNEIAEEVKPQNGEKPVERRKFLRKIWNKLIPVAVKHKQELQQAIDNGEIDSKTGIPNSKAWIRELAEEVMTFKRVQFGGEKRSSTIVYVDVNKLKEINDRDESHAEGDKYLRKTATSLTESVRPGDVVARVGGDEFAMLLRGMSIVDFKDFWTNRLQPTLAKNQISVSVGASDFEPNDVDGSILKADKAMYEAKKFAHIYGENVLKIDGENIR